MKKLFLMATLVVAACLNLSAQTADEKEYECGDDVTITATPKDHYHFVNWSDGQTTPTITISGIGQDYDLTAYFAINENTLTVTSGVGGAITAPTPVADYATGKDVAYNASVTVTASADNCYEFDHWEATGITLTEQEKASLTLTFSMPDNAVTLNAVWKKVTYKVTVRANDDNMGSATSAKQ